jgi:hypothetical protein
MMLSDAEIMHRSVVGQLVNNGLNRFCRNAAVHFPDDLRETDENHEKLGSGKPMIRSGFEPVAWEYKRYHFNVLTTPYYKANLGEMRFRSLCGPVATFAFLLTQGVC